MKRRALFIGAAAALAVATGRADDDISVKVWNTTDAGDLSAAANWSPAEAPTATDYLVLSNTECAKPTRDAANGAQATLSSGAVEAYNFYIGYNQRYSGGTWSWTGAIDPGSTFTMSGGKLTVANELWVDRASVDYFDDTFNMTGGAVEAKNLFIGGSPSTYADETGRRPVASLNLSNSASVTVEGQFHIGKNANAISAVTIKDSASLIAKGDAAKVGEYGTATLTLDGGTFEAQDQLMVGEHAGTLGTINVNGGTFKSLGALYIGRTGGTGVVNFNGGEATLANISWYPALAICWDNQATGRMTVGKDATVTVKNSSPVVGNGDYGHAEMEVSGVLTVEGAGLMVGRNSYCHGTVSVTGGTITLSASSELDVCDQPNSTGMVFVASGSIVNTGESDGGYCIGHSKCDPTEGDASYAYCEISGGTLKNNNGNIVLGTHSWQPERPEGPMTTAAPHSELQMTDGELYAGAGLIVGDFHNAKMVMTGGHVYAKNLLNVGQGVWEGESAEFIIKGGTVETPKVYKAARGSLDIRGGTFKATAEQGNYFENCGDMVVSHKGLTFDTAGFNVTIGNSISGLGGITKTGEGTLTLSGNVTVTGEIKVEEGSLVLNGTTYTAGQSIAATYTPATPATATWTNALEDGDQADPANWACYDAAGEVIEGGVPGATTVVTVPYDKVVNPTTDSPYSTSYPGIDAFTGYASVVVGVSGTVAPRGNFTVPAVVKSAKVWYDFADASTVKLSEGAVSGVANKSGTGSAYDAALYGDANWAAVPAYGAETVNGRAVMKFTSDKCSGFESGALGLTADSARTMISVGRRDTELYSIGIENPSNDGVGQFRIHRWDLGQSDWTYYDTAYSYEEGGETKMGKDLGINSGADPSDLAISYMSGDGAGTVSAWMYSKAIGATATNTAKLTSGGTYGTDANARLYVGVRHQNSRGSNGILAETLLFDSALDDETRQAVVDYLKGKWFTEPETDMDAVFTGRGVALESGATLNFGGGDWTLGSVAVASGGGTIANVGSLTVTGTITITVNSDGTIDGLTVDGDLVLGANAVLNIVGSRYLTDTATVAIRAASVTGKFAAVTTDGKLVKDTYGDETVSVSKKGGLAIIMR